MIDNTYIITLLGLGFILGLKHALDADHVVAVSTIVSQVRGLKKSSLIGAVWGLGHTTTLLLVGLVILLFKLVIPNKVALFFEILVGFVLVILGIGVLIKATKEKIHLHKHKHDNIDHTHFHSHKESPSHIHMHKSFMVGMAQGLAGSAALMLLVLTTVKSVSEGLSYILVFGIGSILGMLIVSGILSLPFLLTAKFENIHNYVKILVGIISIVLGFTIIYGNSLVNSLFI